MTDGDEQRDHGFLDRFRARVDAHREKNSMPNPDGDGGQGGQRVIRVDFLPGERVRLIGSGRRAWGLVRCVKASHIGAAYEIAWPRERGLTWHFAFELETVDE